MSRHTQGVVLILLSAVAFSSAGFFTRLIQLDAWTMLFWRGLFAGLLILCVIVARERGRTVAAIRAIGRPGFAAALCSTAATILFINALRRTSVADVVLIFAVAPFVTAGIGWLWLGVSETWSTIGACLLALIGIGVMVGGAAAEGHLIGDLLALGAAICIAVMMVIIRHQQQRRLLPAACLSALFCPLLVWPLVSPLSIGMADLTNLFLFGTIQFGLGLILMTVGGRLVSATENALIGTLETPLAIAWVWVCFREVPAAASLSGGMIVMAAVAAHVWHGNRSRVAAAVT